MKAKVSKVFISIITGLLGMLGFQSCNIFGGGMVMYGTPHADFNVKGKVTDEDGKPVPGARTVIDSYYGWTDDLGISYSNLDYTDTLYTDSQGYVNAKAMVFGVSSHITVTVTDIDGPENGEFEEKVIENLHMHKVKDGDGSWYGGAYEMEFEAVVKMKK